MQPDQPEPTDTRERFSRVAYGVISSHIDATGTARHAAAGELAELVAVAVDAAYQRGLAEGRTQGRRLAITAVRSQAQLPDLMHFDRPSDFRKGVLSSLAALEAIAEETKPVVSITPDPMLHGHSDGSGFDPNCGDCQLKRAAEEAGRA